MMDPNKIRFSRTSWQLGHLLLQPFCGSLPVVTVEAMTAMVELLLVNGPVPRVVLHERADFSVALHGGNAFVAACRAFQEGTRLGTTKFMPGWAGKSLAELEGFAQRRFYGRDVEVLLIEPGTPDDVVGAIVSALALGV